MESIWSNEKIQEIVSKISDYKDEKKIQLQLQKELDYKLEDNNIVQKELEIQLKFQKDDSEEFFSQFDKLESYDLEKNTIDESFEYFKKRYHSQQIKNVIPMEPRIYSIKKRTKSNV